MLFRSHLRRGRLHQFRKVRIFEDEKAVADETEASVDTVAQPGKDLSGGELRPNRP